MTATRTVALALGAMLLLAGSGCRAQQQTAPDAGGNPAVDLVAQGREQFRAGQYDQAEQSFREALGQHPDALVATYYLGRCAFQKGAYDQAAVDFTEVVTKRPKSADGWTWLGRSDEALKRPKEALAAYRAALQLDPADETTRKAIARLGPSKRIAVTFDGGPDRAFTLKAMDECEKYGGKITFFVIGENLVHDPGVIKLIEERGHEIGNHSYSHPSLPKCSEDTIRYQLGHTNDLIVQQGGSKPTFMRPPYGDQDGKVDRIANAMGMKVVLWDIDPTDWRDGKAGSEVVRYVLSHAKPDAVVLLHQGHNTFTVLDQIFAGLNKLGFACVRLDELPRYPQDVGTYPK